MDGGLFLADPGAARAAIRGREISICVIGIGRIGLPMAVSFAKAGFSTTGVDINASTVASVNRGEFPFGDEPGYAEMLAGAAGGRLAATTRLADAAAADMILLSLPTPMDGGNVPDYGALRSVASGLGDIMREGTVLVVESTVEPGFIEGEMRQLVEAGSRGLRAGASFGLGACPETANPGEIMENFATSPRLVGATDPKTRGIIMEIYGQVFPVELVEMPDCKTANAVKLTTNVFRDINIAFVNELAVLFERLGIDTQTVLNAADKKQSFRLHLPGAGVGGPCIPVNAYQMISLAGRVGGNMMETVRAARRVNESMPAHVLGLLADALAEAGRQVRSSRILVLGVSYKPDVRNIEIAPSQGIVEGLARMGADVSIYDPYFRSATVYGIRTEDSLEGAVSAADAAVIVTEHGEFAGLGPGFFASRMKTPVLVDARRVVDGDEARRAGIIFRGLGQPRG